MRLEDLNFDDPTPEETEMHQKLARDIETLDYFNRRIKKEEFYTNPIEQIKWLEKEGYKGVKVKGGRMDFREALRKGYEKNIFKMYERIYNSK